jgi:hypothetical protein
VFESIVPAPFTDHVGVPAPVGTTFAVKVCVSPTATLGFDGETVTTVGPVELPPLPHPENPVTARIAAPRVLKIFAFIRISTLQFVYDDFISRANLRACPVEHNFFLQGILENFEVVGVSEISHCTKFSPPSRLVPIYFRGRIPQFYVERIDLCDCRFCFQKAPDHILRYRVEQIGFTAAYKHVRREKVAQFGNLKSPAL